MRPPKINNNNFRTVFSYKYFEFQSEYRLKTRLSDVSENIIKLIPNMSEKNPKLTYKIALSNFFPFVFFK